MINRLRNTKLRRIGKVLVVGYAVLYNIALTVFLIISLLSFIGYPKITKIMILWSYIPVVVMIALKTIMDIACSKSSEGGCTMAICKLLLKGLVIFSIGLAIKKLEDKSSSLSWSGIVIPLWIVLAVFGGCTLIAVLLFVTRIGIAIKHRKYFSNDIGVSAWATSNLLFIFGLGVYLLLRGAAFGDGRADIEIFLPACYATLGFTALMVLCVCFGRVCL